MVNKESTLGDLVKRAIKVAEKIYLFYKHVFVIVNIFAYKTIFD